MDKKSDGFTLVELVVVISILGIIVAITVPRLAGFRTKVEERVCVTNRMTIQRLFQIYLFEKGYGADEDKDGNFFNQFLLTNNFDKVCPAGGGISYEGGKVKCGLHQEANEEDEDEPPGDEVPWL